MRTLCLLLAAFLVPLSAQAADPKPGDVVNDPPFAHWSMFAPGTTVTQKETVTLADGAKLVTTKTQKLVEKTADKVVVEMTIATSGDALEESTVTRTTYPAKLKFSEVNSPPDEASVKEGKEAVELKGKKVDAEWYEAVTKCGAEVTTDKAWTARDVPGGIIKETIVRKKGDQVLSESLLEVVDWK
jgi:hypothetical protein